MAAIMDQLKVDHRNVARMLDLLERQLRALHDADQVDFELMHDIMVYMTHYPDTTHHPKEDLMLERLRERDASTAEVVARVMREHEGLSSKGTAFLDMLRHVVDGAMVARDELENVGHDYVDFLRHHMTMEDQQAFPLAEQTLLEEDWAEVAVAFAAQEDPVFGPVVQEQFKALLQFIQNQSD